MFDKYYSIPTWPVLFNNRKLHTDFLLVPKEVTLNDLERRNGNYFVLFHRIRQIRGPISYVIAVEVRAILSATEMYAK